MGWTRNEDLVQQMQLRVKNVLVTLNTYRVRYPSEASIESIMTQLELVEEHLESNEWLTFEQKEAFNFNSVSGTPLEADESLVNELYSIRNYAAHSM
jgi:hypothetical protein